jgi:8-oxo-dGTP pyrophosphatase MutT (NUDIX family)
MDSARTNAFRVPAALLSAARAFAEAGREPVEPRLASTVVLMRPIKGDAPNAFEVYALRRVATMAFAAGMYVFPGGGVDPRDATAEIGWAGPTPGEWAERLGLPEAQARAVVCAAVREVFEESGVLLAGPDATTVVGDVSGAEWEAARVALVGRELSLAEFLAARGLVLRGDLLAPWARWVTPEFEPRRFDTYFFLARLPERQRTRDVGGEAALVRWASPAELAGERPMLPPTEITLRQLAAFDRIEDALDAAGRRRPPTVRPRVDLSDPDDPRFVVPDFPD